MSSESYSKTIQCDKDIFYTSILPAFSNESVSGQRMSWSGRAYAQIYPIHICVKGIFHYCRMNMISCMEQNVSLWLHVSLKQCENGKQDRLCTLLHWHWHLSLKPWIHHLYIDEAQNVWKHRKINFTMIVPVSLCINMDMVLKCKLGATYFSKLKQIIFPSKKVRNSPGSVTIASRSPSQTPIGRGNRQNQTSGNRTNVRKALRLALSSPSEVIPMHKGLKNTRTK